MSESTFIILGSNKESLMKAFADLENTSGIGVLIEADNELSNIIEGALKEQRKREMEKLHELQSFMQFDEVHEIRSIDIPEPSFFPGKHKGK